MSSPKVWLITGASRGLGFELAKAAAKAGHVVVAGRRSSKPTPQTAEIENLGGTWVELDMTSKDIESTIAAIKDRHGKIDVVINNAGYGLGGTAEDISIEAIRDVFEVNVFGLIRVCRAVVPLMRSQGGGTIVNVSSVDGIISPPGISAYSATKHALEGFTEGFAPEVEPFNIRTLIVEPGTMTTEFVEPTGSAVNVPISEPYKDTVADKILQYVVDDARVQQQGASPQLTAARIVEAVDRTGMFAEREIGLRLPLGKDTQHVLEWGKNLIKEIEGLQDVALSVHTQ
uniref:Ketoreductase domain-containing protein n=1 Tax=Bionectria ochroleuca TaxID=29856 RepID=A0A8H7K164_BIOOC